MPLVSESDLDAEFDICVVGSGPAGLACGLSCHDQGLKTLILEAGGERPVPGAPDLLAADISDLEHHDPIEIVSAAALGGTSHWWGGRAVPFDAADFDRWPIAFEALKPWYEDAAAFLGARVFEPTQPPGAFAKLAAFDATHDEVWCPQINMAKRWRARLRGPDGPAVALRARVTGLVVANGAVSGLRVRIGDHERTVRARRYVLACGGLGTLKLLLLAQRDHAELFGGPDGPLGRGYMGHQTGSIADLAFAAPEQNTAFGFRELGGGAVARRQIRARDDTVRANGIGHIAFWLDSASKEDPAHGSPVASAKVLLAHAARIASRSAGDTDRAQIKAHAANVARAPLPAALGLGHALYLLMVARITGRVERPRRFMQASEGAWYIRYHAEQTPDPANRVSLAAQGSDSVGLPRLDIQFRFSDDDVQSVVRAHELLDADLRAAGAGRLVFRGDRDACLALARSYAKDGYHQLGGAIMSEDPGAGVVDAQCRVHGLANLWLTSGGVFPTGGQANPTLTIVALARRLADHLGKSAQAQP